VGAVIALIMLVHEGHTQARRFFTPTNADSYDLVVRLATFGQDIAWKYEIIKAVSHCSHILELACGTGILSSMLAKRGKSVTGIDLTFEYLLTLKRKLKAPIAQGTAEVMPYRDESFDAIVSSYLAKYVNIQKVIDDAQFMEHIFCIAQTRRKVCYTLEGCFWAAE
jgi:demethylmenaquinone methyltransferase/2-methoxy-6-polyprenyl-1,4-benzoquinol methylase